MISKHFFLILLFPLLICCGDNKTSLKSKTTGNKKLLTKIDTVKIIHDTLPVEIRISGPLQYWKKSTIKAYDSSQVIAVMVDAKQNVSSKDLLISLWALDEENEYTPEDIRAPFSGIIENVYVKVGDKLAVGSNLADISNTDFFLMRNSVSRAQLRILEKGMQVIAKNNDHDLSGNIIEINYNSQSIKILFKNKENDPENLANVQAYVICGKVKGEFIPEKFFNNSNVEILIDDESNFFIYPVAAADTLILVEPALPKLDKVLIKSRI